MNKEDLSQALLKARNRLGLSRKELSEKTGVSQSVIQKYEDNATRFSVHTFLTLCEELELNPIELVDPKFGKELLDDFWPRLFEDLPPVPTGEELRNSVSGISFYYDAIESASLDLNTREWFKERYTKGYIEDLFADSVIRVERKKLGLDPDGWWVKAKETSLDPSYNFRTGEIENTTDNTLKRPVRTYSTDEMLNANIRYLNETGKEKLFNSLCDLMKDPANLLKNPIDSEKEE